MGRQVALLRGINIGGHKRVAMANLRHLLTELGFDDVRTYVQSGNAVFTGDTNDARKLAHAIEAELASSLGFDVPVIVRSRAALTKVVRDNPFPAAAADPTKLHVTFLADPLPPAALRDLDPGLYEPEELAVGTQEIYLSLPKGLGVSKLAVAVEKRLEVPGTKRNWRTVTALLDLMG